MKKYYETLLVEEEDALLICTFNRPEVHNAINLQMAKDIRTCLHDASQENLRAVIFTGAGGAAFLSGADIAELKERKAADALRRINGGLFKDIEQFPLPTLAAVEGFALGGGCELAMACDLRVCGAGSKWGQPEVSLGIIPGGGATYRLERLVGLGRAKEMILTGRSWEAQRAFEVGLVNRVVPDGMALACAKELAREIMRNSSLAVRLAKQALNHAGEISTEAGLMVESAMQAILFEDPEKHQRMAAFLERRRPKGTP